MSLIIICFSISNSLIFLSSEPINKYLLLIIVNPPKPLPLFEFILVIKLLLRKSHILIELNVPVSIKL